MAYTGYGAKYTLPFSDDFQGTPGQYVATIYRKDYSGDIIEINGGGSPVVIETDSSGDSGYRPFIPTKASLNLVINDSDLPANWDDVTYNWDAYTQIWNATGFNFTEFIVADIDTFLLEVKVKTGVDTYQIIWQGHYIYNTDVSINEITPIRLTLQFSDTLLMKINKYYNFTSGEVNLIKYYASEYISLEQVIMRCCYFGKITKQVVLEFPYSMYNRYRASNGGTETIETVLDGMYIQKNAFLKSLGKYNTCYDILSGICSQFGLIAYYKNNKIHIKSYENLINDTSRNITEYLIGNYDDTTDYVGYSIVGTTVENDTVETLNAGSNFKNTGRNQTIKFNYPVNDVSIEDKAAFAFNTPNYTMSSVSYIGAKAVLNSWYQTVGSLFPDGIENRYFTTDTVPEQYSMPVLPFYPYFTIKTQTVGIDFASKFVGRNNAGFSIGDFIDSEPFDIQTGDTVAFSYSALTDGRLKNFSDAAGAGATQNNLRPRPVVALVLLTKDDDGNPVEYYYNSATSKFESSFIPSASGSLPLNTTTNFNTTDSDRIWWDFKGVLEIPNTAKIKIRQYQPFRINTYANAPDSIQLYVQYCNLQVFKGSSNVQNLPTTQLYTSTFGSILNSNETIDLKSNLFIMDATRYVPTDIGTSEGKTRNPLFVTSCYTNTIVDKYYNPASGVFYKSTEPYCQSLSYTDIKQEFSSITSNILKNVGLNNVTIDGTYISDASYFIGSKFNYEIIGYYSVDFVLLDYQIDLKKREYSALLYSSLFTDSTGLSIKTNTIIS